MNIIEPTTADPPTSEVSSAPSTTSPAAMPRSKKALRMAGWTARLLFALFLFVGALQLMTTGASGLDVLQNRGFLVRNPGSTLGTRLAGPLFVLSGSPIAATSLTLVAAASRSPMAPNDSPRCRASRC